MTQPTASERQVQAADPSASTWLSANAGSGKTKVLTDRVARLLLDGVEPQHILCLTYTKAAASEMQNRLFLRLGGWAMLTDSALQGVLADMGIVHEPTAATLRNARRLFARAIETPGGLRIQTIHSFCASVLRRFPMEAGVSPQFRELDDRAGRRLRDEIVEEMADSLAPIVMSSLATEYTGEDLGGLSEDVARTRGAFKAPLSRQDALALFGLGPDVTLAGIVAQVFLGGEEELLRRAAAILAKGTKTDIKAAGALKDLSFDPGQANDLILLEDLLLTGSTAKEPFVAKIGSFPNKDSRIALGELLDPLEKLMLRVESARPLRIGLAAAERTLALHRFARIFLKEYAERKTARGWLDFDDLITKAEILLTEPSVAQWVLFRLDGGIDHILVDEAQDTSPAQWRVIELLAQEFTAGRGARDTNRTIFVVGDKKQSIYSFQGADLEAFDAMKLHFREKLSEVRTHLVDLTLEHSFRSSPAILRLVDFTFDPAAGRDLGGEVKHIAFKNELAGRVDLWPAMEPANASETSDWFDPVDLVSDTHHTAQLARKVAAQIKQILSSGTRIPTDHGPRSVHAGDFLILVQSRSVLFSEIIRACKAEGLPIAGADRLKLGGELAVRDLAALLSFLVTPEDDLSLAAALRSPLFGWSEDQLFRLAHGRKGYLWTALRNLDSQHSDTLSKLQDLRDQADFLRPFELLERALTRHDGRRRLLARLGDEAEDGIDELLSQALAYERTEVPSLTGFLGWIQADEIDIKRQADSAGSRIRVMTIHGAKGLESPIVILPETQDRKPRESEEILTINGETAVWRAKAEDSPALVLKTLAENRARSAAENLRLLYVAMTRAQCWLIAAAAGKVQSADCWYNILKNGMAISGAETLEDGTLRLSHGAWPSAVPKANDPRKEAPAIPFWAEAAAPAADRPGKPVSPSGLGGAKVLDGEYSIEAEGSAKARGTLLHLLLEHLPQLAPDHWESRAALLLSTATPSDAASLFQEAKRVLSDPALQPLFAPDTLAEVTITGDLGGHPVLGTVDRLVVRAEKVTAIDFKSNQLVPLRADEVPQGILRQMGAYATVLEQIYPGRNVEVAILWTAGPVLMPLPRDLVMAAMQDIGAP